MVVVVVVVVVMMNMMMVILLLVTSCFVTGFSISLTLNVLSFTPWHLKSFYKVASNLAAGYKATQLLHIFVTNNWTNKIKLPLL
jgi:hypothetical protein